MEGKRLYIIIGILTILLVFFILLNNLFNRPTMVPPISQDDNPWLTPTIVGDDSMNNITPGGQSETDSDPPQKQYDYSFLNYNYPIQYEDLEIDFTIAHNKMQVYYVGSREAAFASIKKFFSQFGFDDPMQANIQIHMQELADFNP